MGSTKSTKGVYNQALLLFRRGKFQEAKNLLEENNLSIHEKDLLDECWEKVVEFESTDLIMCFYIHYNDKIDFETIINIARRYKRYDINEWLKESANILNTLKKFTNDQKLIESEIWQRVVEYNKLF